MCNFQNKKRVHVNRIFFLKKCYLILIVYICNPVLEGDLERELKDQKITF